METYNFSTQTLQEFEVYLVFSHPKKNPTSSVKLIYAVLFLLRNVLLCHTFYTLCHNERTCLKFLIQGTRGTQLLQNSKTRLI